MIFTCCVSFILFLLVCASHTVERVTLPDDDRIYLIELLQETYDDITVDGAKELVYELENFYTGVRDNLCEECGPPYEIDKAFHLHIINTRLYAAFCDKNFGRFIHHSPFWSAHPPPNDLQKRCGSQVQKLRDHGVDIKYENLWIQPSCGTAIQDEAVTTATEPTQNSKYDHWYCDL